MKPCGFAYFYSCGSCAEVSIFLYLVDHHFSISLYNKIFTSQKTVGPSSLNSQWDPIVRDQGIDWPTTINNWVI